MNNELVEERGYSKRLENLEERHARLEIWAVQAVSQIAESVFRSDPKMLDRWRAVVLNHLKNGDDHWISDDLIETGESRKNTDGRFDKWGLDNHPNLGEYEATIVDSGSDSVEDWLEKTLEAMRRDGIPWTINGKS